MKTAVMLLLALLLSVVVFRALSLSLSLSVSLLGQHVGFYQHHIIAVDKTDRVADGEGRDGYLDLERAKPLLIARSASPYLPEALCP